MSIMAAFAPNSRDKTSEIAVNDWRGSRSRFRLNVSELSGGTVP